MSLFPAYADPEANDESKSHEKQPLPWQTNESCPPEVGQPVPIPIPPEEREPSENTETVPGDEIARSPKAAKKKKKKKKKKKQARSTSSSSCESESSHRRRKKKKKARSESSSESRSVTPRRRNSRSRSRGKVSESRYRSHSRYSSKSRSRSRSRSRSSRSKSKPRERRKRRSKSRSTDRLSRKRKFRSRSRSRSWEARSKDRRSYRSRSRNRKRSRSRNRNSSRRNRSQSRDRRRSRGRRSRTRSVSRERTNKKEEETSKGGGAVLREKLLSGNKSVFLDDLKGLVRAEEAFYINVQGETGNKTFTTTHYSQLASYKMKIRGVLGDLDQNIGRPNKKALRYFKKSVQSSLYADSTFIKRIPTSKNEEDKDAGYIPVQLTYEEENLVKKETQPSHVDPLGIYDSKTQEYMLGIGGPDQENTSTQDAEYEYWQSQAKAFNERLGKEPTNISLWLEFVHFQDKAHVYLFRIEDASEKNEKKKKMNQKALAERKISILDSAIKKNIKSTELQFERLDIGQHIWDDKKLKNEWGTFLFNFPNKIKVWHQYLSFSQTHFTSFNLSSVVKTFAKCTERLQQIQNGTFLTHAAPPNIGKCMVDVAVQLAHVWRQAGFMERSIALFQALIEFNLFAPAHARVKNMTLEARLAFFEPFWDSRAPRFGEERASGWAQVVEQKQQVEFPEVILGGTQDEEDELLAEGGSTSRLWLMLETSRERRHWLSWEDDPEECEDPERMVAFEDLEPHIFYLEDPRDHFYMILQFFKFIGVPNIGQFVSSAQERDTAKNKNENSEVNDIFQPLTLESLLDIHLFGTCLQFEKNVKAGEFLNFSAIGPSLGTMLCQDYYRFACQAVLQASNLFPEPQKTNLILLYIRILGLRYSALKRNIKEREKLRQFGKDIKKQVKKLVKSEEYRSSLVIYEEYAKLEEIMEHFDDAENVYVIALTAGTATGNALDISKPNFTTIVSLFTAYIKLQMDREIKTGSNKFINNIIYSLCSLVNDGKFTAGNGVSAPGGSILKAKRKLFEIQESHTNTAFETCKPGKESDTERLFASKVIFFLSIIQLLTVGFKPACLIFETVIDKINGIFKGPVEMKLEEITLPGERKSVKMASLTSNQEKNRKKMLEALYEDYLWLIDVSSKLDNLIRDGKMSPAVLRPLLADAVKSAPENPNFLVLLAQNQNWRDLLGGIDTNPRKIPSILTLVSKLLPHLHKTLAHIANTEEGSLSCGYRLENVLETAVSRPPGRNCPLLWRLYLALVANTQPKKLKSLIYTAIFHCPGVKSLYLDCVRLMPSLLKEIVNLMAEKGVRVRLPLEELQVLLETELELENDDEQLSPKEDEEEI
ncbi:nuclear exosome regulator NRDE2-like [Penaeus indicus]|uniref:nuclear exosome regulator NRDE2-like n=1 Tax=Penaeus indicus TaxID=29960 RepID=UPI00300D1D95